MQVFLAGTDVTIDIPFVDDAGNPLAVTAATYRVVDQFDNEIVPQTNVPGFTTGALSASVTVPASDNGGEPAVTSSDNDLKNINAPVYASRTIQLMCVVGGNTVLLSASYVLRPTDVLVMGLNSFQTYAQAQLSRLEIPNLPGWDAASENDRVAAMIDARDHLCQLNYYLLNTNVNFGQDSLNYLPEGKYVSQFAATNSLFMFNGNLGLLTPYQYSQLPARFQYALRKAQLAEADHILAPDPIAASRQEGLILDAVGQSKQMFRTTKPLQMPVCRRAMAFVSYFITNTKMIGRA